MSGISHVLAIDLGGSKLQVAIVDSLGNIIASEKRTLIDSNYSEESIMKEIRIAAENIIEKSQKTLLAVGISIPGPCDSENGIFLANFSTGVKNWEYAKTLSDTFSLPCFGDNDVNACAVAEKRFGNCKSNSSYIWITLSFGCGGALFLDGKLYKGRRSLAGEVGHIQVVHDSKLRCGCGIYGDMEAEFSGFAIGRKYLEKKGLTPDANFASKEVGKLARQGDNLALELLYEAGYALGRLCSIAQNLLDLEKAVLGGGVCVYEFDFLKPGIYKAIDDCCFPLSKQGFTVEKTALGYDASLLGAASLALNAINGGKN